MNNFDYVLSRSLTGFDGVSKKKIFDESWSGATSDEIIST